MPELMKILIGYDGSECAEAALDDLKRAGLPESAEAHILSIAEVWLPPPSSSETAEPAEEVRVPDELKRVYARTSAAVEAARASAERARERLKANFPGWHVQAESGSGSPAWELVWKADELKPDLIVVGSHGRTALGRFVLGSVSQRVLTEASCSVRIARGRVEESDSPVRIMIGIDGSPGSKAAVQAVATRYWPPRSEVTLVVVDDPFIPGFVGDLIPPLAETIEEDNKAELAWVEKIAAQSEALLQGVDIKVMRMLKLGDPKRELPKAAEEWGADCIFVGSTGFSNRVERFVLGSVSASIAARAHCSVEVVRSRSN
ncbi:MAG TPA: universal stress protein [Pyrinomonadaceae bacterium]|nr:universal stress protein [Pyrinomonadaceae bacterium]